MKITEILTEAQSFSDAQLIKIAREVGERAYGSSHTGLVFSDEIKKMTWSEWLDDMDSTGTPEVDTYDYVFFPSSKKIRDAADTKVKKTDVDIDGKLYIGGADGVKVISDPFIKVKIEHIPDPSELEKWKQRVLHHYSDAVFDKTVKYGMIQARKKGDKETYYGTYHVKPTPSAKKDSWGIMDFDLDTGKLKHWDPLETGGKNG